MNRRRFLSLFAGLLTAPLAALGIQRKAGSGDIDLVGPDVDCYWIDEAEGYGRGRLTASEILRLDQQARRDVANSFKLVANQLGKTESVQAEFEQYLKTVEGAIRREILR